MAILASAAGAPETPGVTLFPNGDVNRDGQVDALDAMFILLYLQGGELPPGVDVGGRVIQVVPSPTRVELDGGESVAVEARVDWTDDQRVTWSSSNASVATVDANGMVHGTGIGHAGLRATSVADPLAHATLPVQVNRGGATSVVVTPAALSVPIGSTASLDASALDFQGTPFASASFAWSSSDPAVAAVGSDGTISGLGLGTATISATHEGVVGTATVVVGTGAPTTAEVTAAATTVAAGEPVGITVVLMDAFANFISTGGASITASTTLGSLAPVADLGDGRYTIDFSSTDTGSATVAVGFNGTPHPTPLVIQVTPGPPAQVQLVASASDPLPGSALTLTATVGDAFGNPVPPGTTVAWERAPALGSLSAPSSATNAAGEAEVTYTAGVGTVTVTATAGAASGDLQIRGVNTAPEGGSPAFEAIGNAAIPVAAPGVLATASDPDPGQTLQAVAGTLATEQGGTVTMAADGSFTYRSAAGFTGTDTFTYDLTDGFDTVSVSVEVDVPTRVFYVQHDAAGGGTGTVDAPFNTLADAQAATPAGSGEPILVRRGGAGALPARLTAREGDVIIGEGVSADHVETLNGSPVVLLAAGAPPLVPGITVNGNDVTLRGLRSETSGTDEGFRLSGFSDLTTSDMEVSTLGGLALFLNGSGIDAHFREVSSQDSPTRGIHLGVLRGRVDIEGGTLAGSLLPAYQETRVYADVTYGGDITFVGDGVETYTSVGIESWNRPEGTLTFSGNLDITGAVRFAGGEAGGGTINLTGPSKRIHWVPLTGLAPSRALDFSPAAPSALNITGGGLQITGSQSDGLYVGEHGTLSITGADNVISMHEMGTGIDIQGTIAPAGVTFREVNLDGVGLFSSGVRLVSTTGPFTVTGSGTAGSGGTVGNHVHGTADEGYAFDLQNAGPVSLSHMSFPDNARASIRALNQGELTVEQSTFSLPHFYEESRALGVEGSLGAVTFRNNEVTGPFQDGVLARPTSGAGTLTLEYNTISLDPTLATARSGIFLELPGGSTATPTFEVRGNSIHSVRQDALSVRSDAATLLRAFIENNTIGLSGVTRSGSEVGNGIALTRSGEANMRVMVRDNTIRQVGHRAVDVQNSLGIGTPFDAHSMNVLLHGNLFEEEVPRDGEAANVLRTLRIGHTPLGAGILCVQVGGTGPGQSNTFEGLVIPGTGVDVELAANHPLSRIFLPGLSEPDGDFEARVAELLVGQNTGLVGGGISVAATSARIPAGQGACVAP